MYALDFGIVLFIYLLRPHRQSSSDALHKNNDRIVLPTVAFFYSIFFSVSFTLFFCSAFFSAFFSTFFSLSLPFSLSLNFQTINWLNAIAYRFDYHTEYFTQYLLLLFSFQYHKYPSKRFANVTSFCEFRKLFQWKTKQIQKFLFMICSVRLGSVRCAISWHQ